MDPGFSEGGGGGGGANGNAWLCHGNGVKERAASFAMAGGEGPGAWSLPQDVGIYYYHVMLFPYTTL